MAAPGPALVLACVVAAWSVARLAASFENAEMESLWRPAHRDVLGGEIFRVPDSAPSLRPPLPSLFAAVCIEFAMLASSSGDWVQTAVLLGIGAASVTWRYTVTGGEGARRRGAPIVALACLLVISSLVRFVEFGGGSRAEAQPETRTTAVSFADDSVRGVVLWPEIMQHTMLVAPLPLMARNLPKTMKNKPLTIPFYGVYWFFKRPYRRPPPESVITRGSADAMTFRSTDRIPLTMEAHQNFGATIDLSCCSKIEIEVSNADRYPGSVALELVLIDTTSAGRSRQSLGVASTTSTPPWGLGDAGKRYSEVLTFPIPASGGLRKFDEVMVRFHLDAVRGHRSAKIAIEKFVLIPRGT